MSKKMKAFKKQLAENAKRVQAVGNSEITKFDSCKIFFDRLAELLQGKYEIVGSCNKDRSAYLIPVGTNNQISYYGKPDVSFRISDHWTWYSNLKKCEKPDEVQCYSDGTPPPMPRNRRNPQMAVEPHKACQVALYSQKDRMYHVVCGEIWNPEKEQYGWIFISPETVVDQLIMKKDPYVPGWNLFM